MSTKNYPKIEFERLVNENWSETEKNNAKIVVDFFQGLMNEHDFDRTLKNYGGGSYVQHNRAIPNNITGLIEYVKTLTKRFPDYSFDVKKIYVDGDYVILHSHTTMKAKHRGDESKGFIITDTFRLEDGKLMEHWDAIQAIDLFSRLIMLMTGGSINNNNSTF
jgi:predicted SnoaL-like aldol condensation-catalyzing enzyme